MNELKPCPFCGGTDCEARTADCGMTWYIFCSDCGLMCGYALTKDTAKAAWNRRAGEDG